MQNQSFFPKIIHELDDVYRATFVKKQDQWILVLDETILKSGEEIWRKIPKMAVPNRYHSQQEYVSLLQQKGFRIHQIYNPHFSSESEWKNYNINQKYRLGHEYIEFSPFVIFIVEKI